MGAGGNAGGRLIGADGSRMMLDSGKPPCCEAGEDECGCEQGKRPRRFVAVVSGVNTCCFNDINNNSEQGVSDVNGTYVATPIDGEECRYSSPDIDTIEHLFHERDCVDFWRELKPLTTGRFQVFLTRDERVAEVEFLGTWFHAFTNVPCDESASFNLHATCGRSGGWGWRGGTIEVTPEL